MLKPIPNCDGYYLTDDLQIYSHKTNRNLAQYTTIKGYKQVTLFINGKQKNFFVHRLIAMTLIPNPNNHPMINHINEIRDDNRVENLEWCNAKHNSRWSLAKPVQAFLDIECTKPVGKVYQCAKDIEDEYGTSRQKVAVAMRQGSRFRKLYWNYLHEPVDLVANKAACNAKKVHRRANPRPKNPNGCISGTKKRVHAYLDPECRQPVSHVWASIQEAQVLVNVSADTIKTAILNGHKAGGYYWNYYDYPLNLIKRKKLFNAKVARRLKLKSRS